MASSSSDQSDGRKKSTNDGIRSGFLGKTGTDESPLDRTYYQILNVSPTASPTEIKKAYYALSLQYHPDRTQSLDDYTRREYAERFKLISQAYTILSDPQKRTLYNRHGKDDRVLANGAGGFSMEEFDAAEFFRLMFGGEEFKDILGDFALAKAFQHTMTELLVDDGSRDTEPTLAEQQERLLKRAAYAAERAQAREERIELLTVTLISKLSLFTDAATGHGNDKNDRHALNQYIELLREDLPRLLQAPYGEQLLHSIGYIYTTKARLWRSKFDSKEGHVGQRLLGYGKHFQASWKERAHVVKETVKTVKSAVQWGQSMSRLAHAADDESLTDPDRQNTQAPFQHHSGRLEYSGYVPPESASPPPVTVASSERPKSRRKSSAQPIVALTEEQKRLLEADTAAKSMEALWRAVKLEIEGVQRDVCDRVLNDSSVSSDMRRSRCDALLKLGELWQQTRQRRLSA